MPNNSIKIFILTLFSIICIYPDEILSQTSHAPKTDGLKILFLSSFDKTSTAYIDLDKGLRKSLQINSGKNNLYTEFFSSPFIPEENFDNTYALHLKKKYRNIKFDYIIAWAPRAINFISSRTGIFKKMHTIYIDGNSRQEKIRGKGITIVKNQADYDSSLEEIIRISSPEKMYVIGTTISSEAQRRLERFKKSFYKKERETEVIYLLDKQLNEVKNILKEINEKKSIALYLLMFTDGLGRIIPPFEAAKTITRDSSIPVFSFWESIMNSGIVGGYLYSHRKIGIELGKAINNGIDNSFLTIHPMRYTYDYRAFSKWNYTGNKIPEKARIINEESQILKKYRWFLAITSIGLAAILFLSFLLIRSLKQKNAAIDELDIERNSLEGRVKNRTEKLLKSNEALQNSYDKFQTLFNLTFEGITVSQDGKIVEVNKTLADMYNTTVDKLLGMEIKELIVPEDREKSTNKILRHDETPYEVTALRPDGTTFPTEIHAKMFSYKNQLYRVSAVLDITIRAQSEKERNANLYHFYNMDLVNKTIHASENIESLMNDILEIVQEIFKSDRAYLVYPCDPFSKSWEVKMKKTKKNFPGVFKTGIKMPMNKETSNYMKKLLESDKTVTACRGNETPISDDESSRHKFKSLMAIALHPKNDKPWALAIHQCSNVRIWDEKEKKLFLEIARRFEDVLSVMISQIEHQESENFLNSIFENIPNMLFVKDAEKLSFIRLNRGFEQLLGYKEDELKGKNDYDILPEEIAKFVTETDRKVISSGNLTDIKEEKVKNRNGEELILHTKKIPIFDKNRKPKYLLGISEDITEIKKLEEQLRQSQKMEAVGQLAGGIAHDFNNMLGVIMGYTELSMMETEPDGNLYKHLAEVKKAADRSSALTKQLLAFARKQTIAPQTIDLNVTIEGMLKMLKRLIGEDIQLSWFPGKEIRPVYIDPGQIDQLLVNLCVNARDAIKDVGKITIETLNIFIDDTSHDNKYNTPSGNYLMLAVSDNGSGMDKETQEKIFEPFFTTKERGKGTGLGLATVYGIIKQNNGLINVYSEPDHGTTFKIYFPYCNQEDITSIKRHAENDGLHGNETVLIVEDEAALLKMSREILEKFGYNIITAPNPNEAISIIQNSDKDIDILITDVIMPQMNGKDLAEKIREHFKNIKILYMSGYTDNIINTHELLDSNSNFIEKPFTMKSLTEKVRFTLDKPD